MFTGIITDVGRVLAIHGTEDWRLRIATSYEVSAIATGASIACDGICLSVVEQGITDGQGWFCVDASHHTIHCTTMNEWQVGTPLNLERALRMGDEMSGHVVFGHVDGVGHIKAIAEDARSRLLTCHAPKGLMRFIAVKGSVTLDGVSLTVNGVGNDDFQMNIIPHTLAITGLSDKTVGDTINIEIDMLARYVARLLETENNRL